MKIIFFAVIPLLLLASCKSNTGQTATDTAAVKPVNKTLSLIKQYKPILSGVWVKGDYVDEVIKTKSTVQAANKVVGITIMIIDTTKMVNDSVMVRVGYDNYQAGLVPLKLRPGKIQASVVFGNDALGYTILNGDTTLTLYQYYQGKLYKTPYIKALSADPTNNIGFGMNYIINKNLISGTYTFTNSNGKPVTVTFKNDGTVSGLLKYSRYVIENDRKRQPMTNLDEITFDEYGSDQHSYAFKIEDNTLNLYETKPNAGATLKIIDKLKYKLVRAK